MPPQNPDALWPVIIAMLVAALIVLLIDLVLLGRWIAYQNRLRRAFSQSPYVFDETPPEGWTPPAPASAIPLETQPAVSAADALTFDLAPPGSPQASPPSLVKADKSPASHPASAADVRPIVVPRPFAKTWSLADPFLGFQAVLILTLVFTLVLGLMSAPFLPGGFTALTNQASDGGKIFLTVTVITGLFIQNGLSVGVVGYYLRRYSVTWQDIGLRRFTKKDLLIGLGLGLAMFAVAGVAEYFLGALLERILPQKVLEALKAMGDSFNAGTQFMQLPGPVVKFLFAIGGTVAAPIGEEIFFRGFLYNALRIRHSRTLAMVVSGFAFALVHASPVAIIIIFPMGMLLAYIYERTQSLWVTILMHAVNNGMSFLLLALFPALGR